MKPAAILPLAAFVAIVALAGFVLMRGGARHDITQAGDVGRAAPAYALAALGDGPAVTPEAFAGRAYVINLFASWCAPCEVEHPTLMALEKAGVEILGVAYKDQAPATQRFLAELGDPYARVGQDPLGRFGLEIGAAGVPETFVISPDGTIAAVYRGPLDETIAQEVILPALQRAQAGR